MPLDGLFSISKFSECFKARLHFSLTAEWLPAQPHLPITKWKKNQITAREGTEGLGQF
jgi:hypothetical protein